MHYRRASQVMTELTIDDVLRHYGARKVPAGVGWHSMKCPFHGDKHASARVNVDRNAFTCLACGMSGDALKIISLKENISRDEAIEFTRKVLGQSVSDIQRSASKQGKRRALGREKWKGILE